MWIITSWITKKKHYEFYTFYRKQMKKNKKFESTVGSRSRSGSIFPEADPQILIRIRIKMKLIQNTVLKVSLIEYISFLLISVSPILFLKYIQQDQHASFYVLCLVDSSHLFWSLGLHTKNMFYMICWFIRNLYSLLIAELIHFC